MPSQNQAPDQARQFDKIIAATVAILFLAICVVIARGDQIGLAVQSFTPARAGSSTTLIQATFDEGIVSAGLEQHFSIEPNVAGTLTVVDKKMTFQPAVALTAGQDYQVTLHAGLVGASGRQLKQDVRWQFNVRRPRIVYLALASNPVQNLFAVDPAVPGKRQQLTHSASGIMDYDVLPDGSKIVYTEMRLIPGHQDEVTDISVRDMNTGESHQLYECQAVCLALAWRPDGGAVAFERVDMNEATGFSQGAPRIWLYESATNSAHPLFADDQILGSLPNWAPDGSRLAFFDGSASAIMIHDFASGRDLSIVNNVDQVGHFSPDGKWLYFPKIVSFPDGNGSLHLTLADLSTDPPDLRDLTGAAELVSDGEAVWRPDSKTLIVPRQPATRQLTQGPSLYEIGIANGLTRLVVPDDGANQLHLALDPSGQVLVFERVALGQPDAQSSLWTYRLSNGELSPLVDQATQPDWLP